MEKMERTNACYVQCSSGIGWTPVTLGEESGDLLFKNN